MTKKEFARFKVFIKTAQEKFGKCDTNGYIEVFEPYALKLGQTSGLKIEAQRITGNTLIKNECINNIPYRHIQRMRISVWFENEVIHF